MSIFDRDDKKSGFLSDVLGPSKPFDPIDKALSPSQADAMDKVNRYQNGDLNHGLSFSESLFADSIKDELDLTLSGIGKKKKSDFW